LEVPGAANVIVKGKLHKENNNLGNKDKGIPVVNTAGIKEYEIEAGELIFRQEITKIIESFALNFNKTKDEALLEKLGRLLTEELLNNTQDNYGKFGVKIKEDEDKDRE